VKKYFISILPVIVSIGLITACEKNEADTGAVSTMQEANAQTPVLPAGDLISGTVLETMDGGGYTYVQLETDSGTMWAAGPIAQVEVGSTVTIETNMPMPNFRSTALERDFDMLYFVGSFGTAGTTGSTSADMSNMENPHGDMSNMAALGLGGEQVTVTIDADIAKAEGGNSIAEILAQQQELADTSVRVRGKVIKYTQKVLGKDWIHIRDTQDGGDLTITTTDKVALGDTILAEGTLLLNKDYGYGYVYEVIMEDASVTVE